MVGLMAANDAPPEAFARLELDLASAARRRSAAAE